MTQIRLLNSGADVKGGSKNVEIAFFIIIIIIRCDVFVPVHTMIVSKKILLLKQHSTHNILGWGIFCFVFVFVPLAMYFHSVLRRCMNIFLLQPVTLSIILEV